MRKHQHPTVNEITEGVIWKQLLLFFFPILFGTFFQQLYNMVDSMVVGKFVGEDALAAVGSSFPVVFLAVAIAAGLSMGCTVVISQLFGSDPGNEDNHFYCSDRIGCDRTGYYGSR